MPSHSIRLTQQQANELDRVKVLRMSELSSRQDCVRDLIHDTYARYLSEGRTPPEVISPPKTTVRFTLKFENPQELEFLELHRLMGTSTLTACVVRAVEEELAELANVEYNGLTNH